MSARALAHALNGAGAMAHLDVTQFQPPAKLMSPRTIWVPTGAARTLNAKVTARAQPTAGARAHQTAQLYSISACLAGMNLHVVLKSTTTCRVTINAADMLIAKALAHAVCF